MTQKFMNMFLGEPVERTVFDEAAEIYHDRCDAYDGQFIGTPDTHAAAVAMGKNARIVREELIRQYGLDDHKGEFQKAVTREARRREDERRKE